MAEVRVPPHSEEAEASVLGSILIDKDAIVAVAEFLLPEHFYKEANQLIYRACLDLYEARKPIDVVTLKEKLKKQKNLTKAGSSAYLTSLVNQVPTAAHVEHYGRIVKDNYTKRELISAAGKIAQAAFDEGQEADQVLDQAEQSVFGLSQKHLRQIFQPVKDVLAESFDRLDELHKKAGGLRGVPTGFKDLDDTLAGMQDSNLLILAARPGVGKTALAANIGQYVAVDVGLPVGFFSLEMSKEELVDRLLVKQADIDAWKLKTGRLDEDDFSRLSVAMGELAEAPLFIDDTPALNVLEMRTKARRLLAEKGLRLLIVDYLQLMRSVRLRESRVQEVSEISQGLKNLARELKVPILAVSQLSREVEKRGSHRPRLADLRESGCLLGETNLIRIDTGERVRIKDLLGKKNIPTLALNGEWKLVPAKIKKVFSSGRKQVFEVLLKSGKKIVASANHPFLKLEGWKRLDELKVGDRVATSRMTNSGGEKTNPNNDVIPKQIWQEIEEEGRHLGWTTRELYQNMNWAYSGTQRHNNGLSRKRLAKIARVMESEKFKQLAESDIFWDEVKAIRKLGVKEVFDAEVEGVHNFLANDIIVHNSIEQDSDVVMFLYREDEEDLENIELEVAKHRNGPLRRLSFRFRGDRISFYPIARGREE